MQHTALSGVPASSLGIPGQRVGQASPQAVRYYPLRNEATNQAESARRKSTRSHDDLEKWSPDCSTRVEGARRAFVRAITAAAAVSNRGDTRVRP